MRTRTKWIADYGISGEEAKQLYDMCKNPDKQLTEMLVEITHEVNEGIANNLLISLISGLSYDKMETHVGLLYCRKEDFYGYKRKCIAVLKDRLRGE